MTEAAKLKFEGGPNIAMKVPLRHYDETVAFYRDVVGLPLVSQGKDTTLFQHGPIRLHIDRVEKQSQTDLWLEFQTNDTAAAKRLFADRRCDEVEDLPKDFDGFWISNPAGVIHLVAGPEKGEP
jgi:hypothetical protein